MNDNQVVAVVGLGYVGYPLAIAFGQHIQTVGFDINETRISELHESNDRTNESDIKLVESAEHLTLSNDLECIRRANIYIVTTPTPVDKAYQPELSAILNAAKMVGSVISANDIVVLESTVYPGVTEGVFASEIEKTSGLLANIDFQLGYSPERINPGDELHRLQHIVKVVSATNTSTLEILSQLYELIIPAGVLKAESIRTAELSKLIENTQRDVNIAFINEMYQLSDKLKLDFNKVLECASSKWNFLDFKPGLVGGHCVAVDPYYLIHSQVMNGVAPRITNTARQVNGDMVTYVANTFLKKLIRAGLSLPSTRILILGVSFKPNCPDVRNSKHFEVIRELIDFGAKPLIYDPVVKWEDTQNCIVEEQMPTGPFDAILLLVPHDEIVRDVRLKGTSLIHENTIFFSLDSQYTDLLK